MLSSKLQKEIWRGIPHKFKWLGLYALGAWAVFSEEPRLATDGLCILGQGVAHEAHWYIPYKYLVVLADLPTSVTLLKRPKGV